MVHHALADARQRGADLDAEGAERARRANPGPQELRRRMDRATAQDDLARCELMTLAVDQRGDARALRAVEAQCGDLGVRLDGEAGAAASGRVEIADRSRDPALIDVGNGEREVAVREAFPVLVGDETEPDPLECGRYRLRMAVPMLDRNTANRNRPELTKRSGFDSFQTDQEQDDRISPP